MIEHQHGITNKWTDLELNDAVSSSMTFGHPGLKPAYVERLIRAYESASYVDFHERWWINRELNPLLRLNRPIDAYRNLGEEESHIFVEWVQYELKDYMAGRRCLFAGAEASVFEKLACKQKFQECSSGFLQLSRDAHFMALDSKIGDDLDRIKAGLSEAIEKFKIDTLLLSLGGGAKILCAELAAEHKICAFDFGGLMRGLTYSGSDGQMFCRSVHHPFFYKVPFDLYMDALEEAFPEYLPEQILCKAQCQVFLEGIPHKVGRSLPTPQNSIDKEARLDFENAYRRYRGRYLNLAASSKASKLLDLEFHMQVSELAYGRGAIYWSLRLKKAILRRIYPNKL
jgi:hypothetical protein